MSPKSHFLMTLAKVVIAAAWADGEMTHEEVNSLKDLLFRLPSLTASEWATLEIYMDSPVDDAERQRLVADLQEAIASPADKDLALGTLRDLVEADGKVSQTERTVLADIEEAIRSVEVGLLGQLAGLVRGAVQRRSAAVSDLPNREIYLDEFVKNKVYYTARRRLDMGQTEVEIPENVLQELSLAGGLMARVAHVDSEVKETEFDTMVEALQNHWGLDRKAAAFVVEIAVSEVSLNLDYFRLTREFFETTTKQKRVGFVDVLFAVAAADGMVSHSETEEIRLIARQLKLTHKEFINAKLKFPAGQRSN